ncbi:MAG: Gp37 family protein [Hafnia sp.]
MNTQPILITVVERLAQKLPGLHVDFFPDAPDKFRLNHDTGAVLVSYGKSIYGKVQDIGAVVQSQTLRFTATIVLRQLNGNGGAVDVLDYVRRALGGWTPPDCRRPIWLIDDVFLGQNDGLWQYALNFATETYFVQETEPDDRPLLTSVTYKEA